MKTEEFQLYERRIDNCFKAANDAKDPDFQKFWQQTAMTLLRKLNYKMNGSVAQLDLEQLTSNQQVGGSSPPGVAKLRAWWNW